MTSRDLLPALRDALAKLLEARTWLEAGQYGDPNGAKCYQADKRISDALSLLAMADIAAQAEGEGKTYGEAPAPSAARATEVTPDQISSRRGLDSVGKQPESRSERIEPSPSPAMILAYGRSVRDEMRAMIIDDMPHIKDAAYLELWEHAKASQAKCDPEQLFYRHPGEEGAK